MFRNGRQQCHEHRVVRPRVGPAAGEEPFRFYDSGLVLSSLSQWAWGHISATVLQETCLKSYNDQIKLLKSLGLSEDHAHKSLHKLASLGSYGKQPHNVLPQLLTYLGSPGYPPPVTFPLYMKVLKQSHQTEAEYPFKMYLPHVLFSWMYQNDRRRFLELFIGKCDTAEKRSAYWRELERRRDPRLSHHPMKERAGWRENCIPIGLHGDGVPVLQVGRAGAKSLTCYSIQSGWVFGKTLAVKMLLYAMFKLLETARGSHLIWVKMVWSFTTLFEGFWPRYDWNGNAWTDENPSEKALGEGRVPLAGGLRGILFDLQGDIEHFSNVYKLRHFNADLLCDFCPCSRDESDRTLLYNNFGTDNRWVRLQYTEASWRLIYHGRYLHPLFSIPGVTHYCIAPDELHIIHLGISQYFWQVSCG